MNIRMLLAALLASVALVAPVQAGNGHHNNGGGGGNFSVKRSGGAGGGGSSFRSSSIGRFSGGGSFRSMPARSFSGNRMIYSGQRFSSGGGLRSQRVTGFRSPVLDSNTGGGSLNANQFARGNRVGGNNPQTFRNGGGQLRKGFAGNRTGGGSLPSNWQNHVFAQRSANWNRNWSRNHDHWWNGHRCHWWNNSWVIFDIGFSPWWWGWDYPYYGYGYGYPYGYSYYPYDYGYDYGYNASGVYGNQPAYDQSYGGGYDQSANSSVAAAQDKLAREGFYRGQIDGVLGPETRHAIVRFQSSRGLRVNGELTSETLDALGLREYASSGYSNY